MARKSNVQKATATGVAGGAVASPLLVWLSSIAATKWSMPIEVAGAIVAPVAATVFGFLGRWAAKLQPDQ